MKKTTLFLLHLCLLINVSAWSQSTVNVYAWGGEIPISVIRMFEHETGIRVHFSTYDSNETLYAKLRVNQRSLYDVILPSAYLVERMKTKQLLMPLDHAKLPQLKNLDPYFSNNTYDPHNQYSIPLIWGTTGIFYNKKYVSKPPTSWRDLWRQDTKHRLMLLDDPREIFSIALMKEGMHANDTQPTHFQKAYQSLLALIPHIKLFASEGVQATMIDEDAVEGIAWNGDVLKAHAENPALQFVYPREGFVVWIDCLAIPRNAPHLNEAYQFIDFLLRPDIAASIARQEGHAITNQYGKRLLPTSIQNNAWIYPSPEVLKRGMVQRDVDDTTLERYNTAWLALKLAF